MFNNQFSFPKPKQLQEWLKDWMVTTPPCLLISTYYILLADPWPPISLYFNHRFTQIISQITTYWVATKSQRHEENWKLICAPAAYWFLHTAYFFLPADHLHLTASIYLIVIWRITEFGGLSELILGLSELKNWLPRRRKDTKEIGG